jgi:hypothetical protein
MTRIIPKGIKIAGWISRSEHPIKTTCDKTSVVKQADDKRNHLPQTGRVTHHG